MMDMLWIFCGSFVAGCLGFCALLYIRHARKVKLMQEQLYAAKRETLEMSRLPLSNPYPMFQIAKNGNLIFANAAAMDTFPDLDEKGMEHHTLKDLVNPFAPDSHIVRELAHDNKIYDQSIIASTVNGTETLIVYYYDITARKHVEEEIKQARKLAEQARLSAEEAKEARGEFLANMSHELRTPMNGIIGISDLLVEAGFPAEQQTLIEAVNSSAKNLLILLNDILDFSKIEAGELTMESIAFSPRRVIAQIEALQKPLSAQKGLRLVSHIDENVPPMLVGDPSRLQQILNNLISNALKFTDRGSVTMSVCGQANDQGVFITEISVADTGIGIPKEKQAQIFEKFQQADTSTARKYGGTGLGLSITKDLTRLMGGNISIESEEGQGTTFTVVVPMQISAVLDDHDDEQDNARVHHVDTNKRVLIVDDHPINLLFMRKALQKIGFSHLDEATSGKQAVELFKSNPYPLVLMDVQMPEMNGFEAAQAIRAGEGAVDPCVILAVTADAMKGAEEKCKQAGMDDYISKPVDKEKLAGMLRKWLPYDGDVDVARPAETTEVSAQKADGLFDWNQIREFTEGDRDMEVELLNIFIENLENDLMALEASFSADDYVGWDASAHKLYGACAHIGAVSMAAVCDQAQSIKEDEKSLMQELHAEILSEFKKVRVFLEERRAA